MPTKADRIQSKINRGYGKAAAVLGQPFDVYRPTPVDALAIGNRIKQDLLVSMSVGTNQIDSSYTKTPKFDDLQWIPLFDPTGIMVGDVFVADETYFVASMESLLPFVCIRCNQRISLTRETSQLSSTGGQSGGLPSQHDSSGTYWGSSAAVAADETQLGRRTLWTNVPAMIASIGGKATAVGLVPSDSAGPNRWRIYVPQSCCPQGSVRDRDILVDSEGLEYQVSAAIWTPLGYRLEVLQLEN